MDWFESRLCPNGEQCYACRTERRFREDLMQAFDDILTVDFECPYGKDKKKPEDIQISQALEAMGLDALIAAAKQRRLDKRISHYIRYIEEGRWEDSKCPECARKRVATHLRQWLAEEEAKDGA